MLRQAQWRPNRIRWIGSTTRRPRFYFSRANLSPALLIDETIRTSQRIGCSKQAVQVSPALVHMIQVPLTSNLLPLDRPPLPSRTATTYKYRRKQMRARQAHITIPHHPSHNTHTNNGSLHARAATESTEKPGAICVSPWIPSATV